jgi:hypothetical protein
MPVVVGEQYRLFAAHCIGIAQETAEPNRKLALLDMAQAWIALAEQAEKNSGAEKTGGVMLFSEPPGHGRPSP